MPNPAITPVAPCNHCRPLNPDPANRRAYFRRTRPLWPAKSRFTWSAASRRSASSSVLATSSPGPTWAFASAPCAPVAAGAGGGAAAGAGCAGAGAAALSAAAGGAASSSRPHAPSTVPRPAAATAFATAFAATAITAPVTLARVAVATAAARLRRCRFGTEQAAEQAGEEARLFHRQDRTVLHVAQARVAIGTRHGPAVGAATAIALARHGTAPHTYPSDPINERSGAQFPLFGAKRGVQGGLRLAGVEGFEPPALGFGDRCSTS